MNWNTILSEKRTGKTGADKGIRTNFQRDFDRLIFSSAFRRLQNKTQIFPLPGSTFVHNRLTHSLEVASVGRSLGKHIGEALTLKQWVDDINIDFYKYELQNVIAAACLAHDIGNPSFGHSGETAIANYFIENQNLVINNSNFHNMFAPEEWADLVAFEGNANSLRVLTNQFNGKAQGGYQLTYITLASIMKYPCEALCVNKANINTKKFSIFQSEKQNAIDIFNELNIPKIKNNPLLFVRHPFVFLTEAADDICYRIVDFEDAQRLGIISAKEVADMFINLITEIGRESDNIKKIEQTYNSISDKNEGISYLRAKCINALTLESADLFMKNADSIINGTYNQGLLDELTDKMESLKEIKQISNDKIYNHHTVVELEIAGYRIMNDLLSLFIPAALKNNPNDRDKKVLQLLPSQFKCNTDSNYYKVLSVLDYVSGMTDLYAVELYRNLFGIDIPKHS